MCNGGIRGLAGTVTHHRVQTMGVSEADGLKGVGKGPDLVWLDEDAVCRTGLDALLDAVDLGNKDVVPAQQALVANLAVEFCKRIEIVFVERIFDIDKVVFVDEPSAIYAIWSSVVRTRSRYLLPGTSPHLARRNVDTHIDPDIHLVCPARPVASAIDR